MGYALESTDDHILPYVASFILPHCFIVPQKITESFSLYHSSTKQSHHVFLLLSLSDSLCFRILAHNRTSRVSHHLVNRLALLIKKYLSSALPEKEDLPLLLAVISPCFSYGLGKLIHPQIRSYSCARFLKTNTALPTQHASPCLRSQILKLLLMRKVSIFNMAKIFHPLLHQISVRIYCKSSVQP